MKIFISWSGELSHEVALKLKKGISRVIQSVDIFVSSEDIEKGENWNRKLSAELSECDFGIICLTSENIDAPWINFEAGALAKEVGSRLSAFLTDINVSDLKGPLAGFQNTRFEKQDFYKLIESINKTIEKPVENDDLKFSFDNVWKIFESEVKDIINKHLAKSPQRKENRPVAEVAEEILGIVRGINSRLPVFTHKYDLTDENILRLQLPVDGLISASKEYDLFLNNDITNRYLSKNSKNRMKLVLDGATKDEKVIESNNDGSNKE
ncbi:MAG: toll/interleukin-1 receptor domain-containing protein [Oscillospiraceae bacterium]|nr:toll/interleukin-1 receptor domain-containing protein [Oscillospiraceae bacterium]